MKLRNRLRDTKDQYLDKSITQLIKNREKQNQDLNLLYDLFKKFTPLDEHVKFYRAAHKLRQAKKSHPKAFVEVEGKRCLDLAWNPQGFNALQEMAVEGQSAVLALHNDCFYQILGTCIKIHDDGDHLDFQPLNTEEIKYQFAEHSRSYYFNSVEIGKGWTGWLSEKSHRPESDMIERFKVRTLHVSEINKYHQFYDRGVTLGPKQIETDIAFDEQHLRDLDVIIAERKAQKTA